MTYVNYTKNTLTQIRNTMKSTQFNPMKLIAITPPGKIKFEADTINRLFREGLDELHLHKPQYDKEAMKKFIQNIDAEYHDRLVLHSHYSLVHTFDIQKIHLNRKWKQNFVTNLYLEKVILKGKKIHKTKTVKDCKELYKPIHGLDEVILGPVFGKTMYYINKQEIQTKQLESAVRHSKLPVTALGGITVDTLDFFENVGFKSLALQSALWKNIDPVKAFVEIRDYYRAQQYKMAS